MTTDVVSRLAGLDWLGWGSVVGLLASVVGLLLVLTDPGWSGGVPPGRIVLFIVFLGGGAMNLYDLRSHFSEVSA